MSHIPAWPSLHTHVTAPFLMIFEGEIGPAPRPAGRTAGVTTFLSARAAEGVGHGERPVTLVIVAV